MKKKRNVLETIVHGIFLLLGLITVGCVLVITVYLVVSGIPAIREIGLVDFLFGEKWASTAAEPSYGILPFILTSIYGTAGAIVIGVPIGFFTAVYLAKAAQLMVTEAVDAYVKQNLVLARKVMAHDDVVDDYFRKIKTGIIDIIAAEPAQGEYALDLLMIAKYFERIGDHCTNIAEWVEFFVTGAHKDCQ